MAGFLDVKRLECIIEASTKVLALFSLKNRPVLAVVLAIGLLTLAPAASAHDIPADSTVRMFASLEGRGGYAQPPWPVLSRWRWRRRRLRSLQ